MPTFHTVPDDGDFVIHLVEANSTECERDGGRSTEDFCDGLRDLGHAGGYRSITEVVIGEIIRIRRSSVCLYGGEVGPSSIRELRSDAVADILRIQVKIAPFGKAEVILVSVIFAVVT